MGAAAPAPHLWRDHGPRFPADVSGCFILSRELVGHSGVCAPYLPGRDAFREADRALGYLVQQGAAKLDDLRNLATR